MQAVAYHLTVHDGAGLLQIQRVRTVFYPTIRRDTGLPHHRYAALRRILQIGHRIKDLFRPGLQANLRYDRAMIRCHRLFGNPCGQTGKGLSIIYITRYIVQTAIRRGSREGSLFRIAQQLEILADFRDKGGMRRSVPIPGDKQGFMRGSGFPPKDRQGEHPVFRRQGKVRAAEDISLKLDP